MDSSSLEIKISRRKYIHRKIVESTPQYSFKVKSSPLSQLRPLQLATSAYRGCCWLLLWHPATIPHFLGDVFFPHHGWSRGREERWEHGHGRIASLPSPRSASFLCDFKDCTAEGGPSYRPLFTMILRTRAKAWLHECPSSFTRPDTHYCILFK